MNTEVAALSPPSVWESFEKLNEVPRPSKKEERVIAFMKNFGESLGLETKVDEVGNILIRKPATAGMENRKTVVLQAHLDMVHQKNADTDFDFSSEGIKTYIADGWVKAQGTTLGADNGMGAASIMAILQANDIEHGPLEALFTIDEETGMTGAKNLQPGFVTGDILLNTDTEDEGELTIGCAGGIDTNIRMRFVAQPAPVGIAYRLSVKGLLGGHSGTDIHLGHGNANKIMNRLLYRTDERFGLRVAEIDGGSLRNAIPRESFATVIVPQANAKAFGAHVEEVGEIIKAELIRVEKNLSIQAELLKPGEVPEKVMPAVTQKSLVRAIYAAPNGVQRMSTDIPDLVETSTSLARVLVRDGEVLVQFLTRSSVDTAKDDVANAIAAGFEQIGAEVEHGGDYPGWNPNPDSDILRVMKPLYQELFGEEAHVVAVHAGLECGLIGKVYPKLDMISFGPTIKGAHSPDERCHIDSVDKYWKYLLETLKRVPEKK
jgi:dipeptidase D